MILSDNDISNLLNLKSFSIDPLNEDNIGPASIDLTLSNEYAKINEQYAKSLFKDKFEYTKIINDSYRMESQEFVLASTKEKITLPSNVAAFIEGRSSIGRLGLFIHNAGWIDPGFSGTITLELYNSNKFPLILDSGEKICQMILAETKSVPNHPYCGRYQGQFGVTESRLS